MPTPGRVLLRIVHWVAGVTALVGLVMVLAGYANAGWPIVVPAVMICIAVDATNWMPKAARDARARWNRK